VKFYLKNSLLVFKSSTDHASQFCFVYFTYLSGSDVVTNIVIFCIKTNMTFEKSTDLKF